MWKVYTPKSGTKEFLVCTDCDAVIDISHDADIHVTPNEFDFCPYCGSPATEHGIELWLERNNSVNQYWNTRRPTESEYLRIYKDGEKVMRRLLICYNTDIKNYAVGYYDGYKWMKEFPVNQIINKEDVIAWHILDTYDEPIE